MHVSLAPRAVLGLEQIGDYIARDNSARALTFVNELLAFCRSIAGQPRAYPVQRRLHPKIRRALHGRYAVFYIIDGETVRIERVLHGARHIDVANFRLDNP